MKYLIYAMIALLPMIANGQENFDSVKIKTTKITNSVFMLEGSGGNIGVLVGNDGIILIDDQFDPLTEKIKRALAEVSDKPVKFVINTHYHGDHSGGNVKLGRDGAIIVSQKNTRERLSADQFITLFKSVMAVPSVDEQMKKELGLATTEMKGKSLNEAINLPSLNINGMQS